MEDCDRKRCFVSRQSLTIPTNYRTLFFLPTLWTKNQQLLRKRLQITMVGCVRKLAGPNVTATHLVTQKEVFLRSGHFKMLENYALTFISALYQSTRNQQLRVYTTSCMGSCWPFFSACMAEWWPCCPCLRIYPRWYRLYHRRYSFGGDGLNVSQIQIIVRFRFMDHNPGIQRWVRSTDGRHASLRSRLNFGDSYRVRSPKHSEPLILGGCG